MNKIILIFLTLFVLNGCGYESLLANKTYNFKLVTIGFDRENELLAPGPMCSEIRPLGSVELHVLSMPSSVFLFFCHCVAPVCNV